MKNFLKVLCVLTLAFNVCYGAVYRTGVAEGSVTYSGGGSGNGSGTNYVYIYTNGMPGSEVTNVVAAFTTNKIDNLNGKGTNTTLTNVMLQGPFNVTNASTVTWKQDGAGDTATWQWHFASNGGSTYTWQWQWTSNTFNIKSRVGGSARDFFTIYRDGSMSWDADNVTNNGTFLVLGDMYLNPPSGTATNLTLDPNGKIVAQAAPSSLTLSNLSYNINTRLASTNGNGVTNILITPEAGAVIDLYATNNLSWTNFTGFAAGTYVRQTYRVTPTLINRTNLWPTFGTPASGVLVGTNDNSTMWTTFTNGHTYYVTFNAFGTNLIVACTRFSN